MTADRHSGADHELLTIGRLARRVGMRTSALRFYEAEGLVLPSAYSESGYRLYSPAAEQTLRFIQRAQRLGFALADIKALIDSRNNGVIDERVLIDLARQRLIVLERQITPQLVLRHELGTFLRDLQSTPTETSSSLDRLIDHVCAEPHRNAPEATLEQLMAATGCVLTGAAGQAIIAQLRGCHVHLWQEGDAYHILVVGNNPQVGAALAQLAQLEAGCDAVVSAADVPELQHADDGYLFVARGAHAFLFARLFLALEHA